MLAILVTVGLTPNGGFTKFSLVLGALGFWDLESMGDRVFF